MPMWLQLTLLNIGLGLLVVAEVVLMIVAGVLAGLAVILILVICLVLVGPAY